MGAWALAHVGAWLPCSPPPGRGSSEQSTQDRMPPFMRDFFPTGKFKNARIAPHNRWPKMAINKRRFLREATYARRCLRGRSCVRGRVVPCPAPQPGKVSGMGMQDRMTPRMRKKIPASGFYASNAGPGRLSCSLPGGRSRPQEPLGRPQRPPPPGRFCLPYPLPGGRSRPQEPPGRPQRPPPPGRSACPLPYQGAAAGPRSRQGNRRDLRRRGGYFQCQEGL